MTAYHFVVNPGAAGVRFETVSRILRREFGDLAVAVTPDLPLVLRERGGVRSWPENRILVAVGGDGTLNRVVNAVGESGIPVGILPGGTANDAARGLGIPLGFTGACAVLKAGRTIEIDLALVGGTYFVTGGGLGLGVMVAARANRIKRRLRGLPRLLGPALYPLCTLHEVLREVPRLRVRLERPGSVRMVDVAALLVSNQPRLGGRFSPSPSASHRDGLLDLCLVDAPRSRTRMARICVEILRHRSRSCPEVSGSRFRELAVTTETETPFFGDGEILCRGREFVVRVRPRALRIVAPGPGRLRRPVIGEAGHGV
jgi:diacylglycerol kinase (ATP)